MSLRATATELVQKLVDAGHVALFAGGCVRDVLLNLEPGDYDIATSARPEQVESIFERTIPVGRRFGILIVNYRGHSFEVATFRSDGDYLDGRHPETVTFADAHADSDRRDFTINSMFEDPLTDEIIDYNNGKRDLEAGLVRAVGDPVKRFSEDRLRMLRAVRFAARLGFEIDPATMQAARDHADTLELVSAERIADELVRVLTEGSARRGFELMDEAGLLEIVLPEITAMKGVEQDSDFHPEGDVYVHTLACIEQLEAGCTATLALGLLLHDVAKPPCHVIRDGRHTFHGHTRDGSRMAESICRRLRMSNATIERVSFLVDQHLRHCSARDMKQSTLKRFLGQDGIEELLEVVRMDGTSSSSDLGDYQFCSDSLRDMPEEVIKPTPLVTGHDLVEMGMKPGPRFKELLATVEDAQLEGRLETREQALELLRDLLD